MGEVEVEGLVERESGGVVVEGEVDLRDGVVDDVVLEPGEDLLHVADSDCASRRGLKAVAPCEVEVDGVFVTLPFFEGEEVAEGGVAEGDGFVGAHALRVVGVGYCPVESWSVWAEAFCGVCEVDVIPFYGCVITAGADGFVAVGAVVVAS